MQRGATATLATTSRSGWPPAGGSNSGAWSSYHDTCGGAAGNAPPTQHSGVWHPATAPWLGSFSGPGPVRPLLPIKWHPGSAPAPPSMAARHDPPGPAPLGGRGNGDAGPVGVPAANGSSVAAGGGATLLRAPGPGSHQPPAAHQAGVWPGQSAAVAAATMRPQPPTPYYARLLAPPLQCGPQLHHAWPPPAWPQQLPVFSSPARPPPPLQPPQPPRAPALSPYSPTQHYSHHHDHHGMPTSNGASPSHVVGPAAAPQPPAALPSTSSRLPRAPSARASPRSAKKAAKRARTTRWDSPGREGGSNDLTAGNLAKPEEAMGPSEGVKYFLLQPQVSMEVDGEDEEDTAVLLAGPSPPAAAPSEPPGEERAEAGPPAVSLSLDAVASNVAAKGRMPEQAVAAEPCSATGPLQQLLGQLKGGCDSEVVGHGKLPAQEAGRATTAALGGQCGKGLAGSAYSPGPIYQSFEVASSGGVPPVCEIAGRMEDGCGSEVEPRSPGSADRPAVMSEDGQNVDVVSAAVAGTHIHCGAGGGDCGEESATAVKRPQCVGTQPPEVADDAVAAVDSDRQPRDDGCSWEEAGDLGWWCNDEHEEEMAAAAAVVASSKTRLEQALSSLYHHQQQCTLALLELAKPACEPEEAPTVGGACSSSGLSSGARASSHVVLAGDVVPVQQSQPCDKPLDGTARTGAMMVVAATGDAEEVEESLEEGECRPEEAAHILLSDEEVAGASTNSQSTLDSQLSSPSSSASSLNRSCGNRAALSSPSSSDDGPATWRNPGPGRSASLSPSSPDNGPATWRKPGPGRSASLSPSSSDDGPATWRKPGPGRSASSSPSSSDDGPATWRKPGAGRPASSSPSSPKDRPATWSKPGAGRSASASPSSPDDRPAAWRKPGAGKAPSSSPSIPDDRPATWRKPGAGRSASSSPSSPDDRPATWRKPGAGRSASSSSSGPDDRPATWRKPGAGRSASSSPSSPDDRPATRRKPGAGSAADVHVQSWGPARSSGASTVLAANNTVNIVSPVVRKQQDDSHGLEQAPASGNGVEVADDADAANNMHLWWDRAEWRQKPVRQGQERMLSSEEAWPADDNKANCGTASNGSSKPQPHKRLDQALLDLWDWRLVDKKVDGESRDDTTRKGRPGPKGLLGRIAPSDSQLHPALAGYKGLLRTAAIIEATGDLVRVASGKIYRLRKPNAEYVASLGGSYHEQKPTSGWKVPPLSGCSPTKPLQVHTSLSLSEAAGEESGQEARVGLQSAKSSFIIAKPFVPFKVQAQ
eukprot:SM000134S26967  [mRNA]  locus=s134:315593:320490:- [translate_table: standard]